MSSNQMLKFGDRDVSIFVHHGTPYFKAVDVTTILQYKKSANAIRLHVSPKYVKTLQDLTDDACEASMTNALNQGIYQTRCGKSPLYISEPGVYELAFRSNQAHAVLFREWIVEDVLPQIRKTGVYARKQQMHEYINNR